MPELIQQELDALTFGARDDEAKERLGELMLYVADQCADDPTFGATKLNKVLYFSDLLAYAHFAAPISGCQYMRLDHGPAPRHLLPVRNQLIESGDAINRERTYGGFEQNRLVPLRPANIDRFTPSQIKLVDEVVAFFKGVSASQVSEFSHDRVWEIAEENQGNIPYEAIFISDDGVTEEDHKYLKALDSENAKPN